MDEPDESNEDQSYDLTDPQLASETQRGMDFSEVHADSNKPLTDEITRLAAGLQSALAERISDAWTKRQQEMTDQLHQSAAKLQAALVAPTEIYPSALKHVIDTQQKLASAQAKFEDQWKEHWNQTSQAIEGAMKRTLPFVERLAELGWTLPTEMWWPDFQTLAMQEGWTEERVNERFVAYYTEDDASEFKRLTGGLLSSRQLAPWKLLIEQCVRAFEKGDFALCAPSLLLILEGSIAKPWGVKFEHLRNRQLFFDRKISAAAPGSIRKHKWRSVSVFTDIVFNQKWHQTKSTRSQCRHLILHGKSDPAAWDRTYCLRLFQAISTVASLGKEIIAVKVAGSRKS